ncbi:ArsR/SmtB family transcription factor [Tunturiibacter gelidoferens]|uniref:ArsR/SmtB family transcription factor n=1 Tax=Tunturiibacter gelidiferens TaxID=3069689 RepID=UPI0021B0F8F1|nr:ArsR family transcriptional regulator [Edaphobacter lichenicola]
MNGSEATFQCGTVFQALGNSSRLRILNLFGEEEICVCYFVEILGGPQPKISRHLASLPPQRRCHRSTARREVDALSQGHPAHTGAEQIFPADALLVKGREGDAGRQGAPHESYAPAKYALLEGAPLICDHRRSVLRGPLVSTRFHD